MRRYGKSNYKNYDVIRTNDHNNCAVFSKTIFKTNLNFKYKTK